MAREECGHGPQEEEEGKIRRREGDRKGQVIPSRGAGTLKDMPHGALPSGGLGPSAVSAVTFSPGF